MKTGCLFAGARRASILAACGLVVATSGGAWASSDQPAPITAEAKARIGEICQTTLGLGPSEPVGLVWGAATMPGLMPGENHYQGCVASLSGALRDAGLDHPASQASSPRDERLGSFFTASNGEVRRRERVACARLGLTPDSIPLERCVADLSDTFFAIDNPQS